MLGTMDHRRAGLGALLLLLGASCGGPCDGESAEQAAPPAEQAAGEPAEAAGGEAAGREGEAAASGPGGPERGIAPGAPAGAVDAFADDGGAAAPGTRLVLLGTGTPVPYADRAGPALAIVVDGHAYLVDLGVDVVRQAVAAAQRRGIAALAPTALRTVFVTHLHSDHTLGYPDLMLTPWIVGRSEPLRVWGPPGLDAMTDALEEAYRADIRLRTRGLEEANETGHRVQTHEIAEPGLVYEDERVRVRAFAVQHGSWDHAFGYRFETDDRVIVVSGDTRPTDAVVDACDGCDVLVHEVYSSAGAETLPPDARRYHRRFHTSAAQLGELAKRARPELLVLHHQLLWGAAPSTVTGPISARWEGRVEWGDDLDVF